MLPSLLLYIACSLDPQGALCQAYGGPCIVLNQGCPSVPIKHIPEGKDILLPSRKR